MNRIKAYTSSETLRYKESTLEFKENKRAEMKLVKMYPEIKKQEILGFGGAFTEAAAETAAYMEEADRKRFFELYFGENGIGYSFCRTHIQSCDFALGNYAYIEDKEDKELKTFSIARDRKYLIPMIKEALSLNPKIILLASPWSPPAFMKSNGEMNHGGVLKKEYYQMWADMVARYLEEYRNEGINISYLTIQNEPKAVQTWDSCIYTAEEEGIFAARYLRPALDERGFGNVKILAWDHNKDCIIERTAGTLGVEGAADAISGIAFHWYTGDHFEALREVRTRYPDKELIFTEGCVEYSRFRDAGQVKYAEMYLHDMLGNINCGMSAYTDWNLLLNEEGGPNHVGNFCDAPVMYNRQDGTLNVKLSYYYIGHLSRFVKPGARNVLVSRCTDRLDTAGFVNPDGGRVLVMMNPMDEESLVSVCEGDMVCPVKLEPHTAVTLCWN